MNERFTDYFLVLQVHYMASDEVIKAAYKRLCQKHHPDAGGRKSDFHQLHEAYDVLIHSHKKKAYMKTWLQHYGGGDLEADTLLPSAYDIQFKHLKTLLHDYLSNIRDERYIDAYNMLSEENKKRLFPKDFVQWQKLISEIHHLLEYESVIHDVITEADQAHKAILKVKVKEYNQLLHRVETDYFYRAMVYENGWKIHLKNCDVRATIRKYKKILAMNNKAQRKVAQVTPHDDNHMTKFVSKRNFINHCEYEWMRFERYNSIFSILSIKIDQGQVFHKLENIISEATRALDTYCVYHKHQYYILLPETPKSQGKIIVKKFLVALTEDEGKQLSFRISQAQSHYTNVKEMLDRVK